MKGTSVNKLAGIAITVAKNVYENVNLIIYIWSDQKLDFAEVKKYINIIQCHMY